MTVARERLLDAAVEAFAEHGFTATTTRDIASRAGMSPAAVYVHHATKEELLFTLSLNGHHAALNVIEQAGTDAPDAVAEVRQLVYAFSLWHAQNSRVGRIVQYEFRSLTSEHRAQIASIRRQIEAHMQDALKRGVAQGVLDVPNIADTARALLSLSIDLVRWFDPHGSQPPDQIAALHADLAARMTAARRHPDRF